MPKPKINKDLSELSKDAALLINKTFGTMFVVSLWLSKIHTTTESATPGHFAQGFFVYLQSRSAPACQLTCLVLH